MEKKLRTIRFIPTIVVQTSSIGQFIATSSCLYEDLILAREALVSLESNYSSFSGWKIVRSSIIRKVIEL